MSLFGTVWSRLQIGKAEGVWKGVACGARGRAGIWQSRSLGKERLRVGKKFFCPKEGLVVRERATTTSAAELPAGYMTVLTSARVSASPYAINGQYLRFGTLGTGLGFQDSANQEFVVEWLYSI